MEYSRRTPSPFTSALKSRQVHRLIKFSIVTFLVLNIIYFTFIPKQNYSSSNRHHLQTISPDAAVIAEENNAIVQHPQQGGRGGSNGGSFHNPSSTFEALVQNKFEKIKQDPDRYHMANTDLTEVEIPFNYKPFSKKYEDENSWAKKDILFYDPRFTLSMYLNELKLRNLVKKGKDGPLILPFNWVDWMDLTILNKDLSYPLVGRTNCNDIRQVTNNDPDPSYFCMDNHEFPMEKIEKLGYTRSQLPGFIIHDHSTHDDRPLNDYRILEARSYAMTHLRKPLKVVILNGDQGTFEFEVDQGSNQRLAGSDIVDNFIKSNKLTETELTHSKLNHLQVWQDLKTNVPSQVLTPDDPGYRMYSKIHHLDSTHDHQFHQDSRISRELPLTQQMFSHPPSIESQIAELDEKRAQNGGKLSHKEQIYYESLVDCLQYPDESPSDEFRYFRMAIIRMDDERNVGQEWGWHYDWRFFNGALEYAREGWNQQELTHRTNIILDRLLRSWNRFAEQKGIISWIMHGPLLSWYWDGLMFPFDNDIDIQMPVMELVRLAKEYNQTLIVEDPSEGYGKYLIDVNPYMHHRGISKESNHIDARVVDVDSGIYIDITALSKLKANLPEEYYENGLVDLMKNDEDDQVEIYNDRRKHFYKFEQLSPLRYSMLQGVPVFIPSTITHRLIFEYSEGLDSYEYNGWYFIKKLNLWIKQDHLVMIFNTYQIKNQDGNVDRDKLLAKVSRITDDEVLKLLDIDDILVEYYLTKELTDFHAQEMKYLFDAIGRDNLKLGKDPRLTKEYNDLTKGLKMRKPLRKALYDYENIERLKYHNWKPKQLKQKQKQSQPREDDVKLEIDNKTGEQPVGQPQQQQEEQPQQQEEQPPQQQEEQPQQLEEQPQQQQEEQPVKAQG